MKKIKALFGFLLLIPLLLLNPTNLQAKKTANSFYVLTIKARINPNKSNGNRWDFGFGKRKKADPTGNVRIGNDKRWLSIWLNRHRPQWTLKKPFKLKGKTKIKIRLVDKDLRHNDWIGSCHAEINPKGRSKIQVKIPCGQAKLTILLRKLQAQRSVQ